MNVHKEQKTFFAVPLLVSTTTVTEVQVTVAADSIEQAEELAFSDYANLEKVEGSVYDSDEIDFINLADGKEARQLTPYGRKPVDAYNTNDIIVLTYSTGVVDQTDSISIRVGELPESVSKTCPTELYVWALKAGHINLAPEMEGIKPSEITSATVHYDLDHPDLDRDDWTESDWEKLEAFINENRHNQTELIEG